MHADECRHRRQLTRPIRSVRPPTGPKRRGLGCGRRATAGCKRSPPMNSHDHDRAVRQQAFETICPMSISPSGAQARTDGATAPAAPPDRTPIHESTRYASWCAPNASSVPEFTTSSLRRIDDLRRNRTAVDGGHLPTGVQFLNRDVAQPEPSLNEPPHLGHRRTRFSASSMRCESRGTRPLL